MPAGHPDFDRAITIARSIPDSIDQAWTLTEIGKRQGHTGVDPIGVVEELQKIKRSLGPSFTRNIDWNLANVLAAAGSFRQAEVHVAATEDYGATTPLRYLVASEKSRCGVDPTPDLRIVSEYFDALFRQSPLSGVKEYAELATVIYETTGVYPSFDLSLSEALLAENERQYPTDRLVSGWHGDVAQAFASCGNFEDARRHEHLIVGHSPIETMLIRSRTLRHIVGKQLEFGDRFGAAETGRDAIQIIEHTPAEPPHLIVHLQHKQTFGVASLWPLVGTAETKSGLDPSPSFRSAEKAIETINDGYWTANALMMLAHAKKAAGRDPNLTMNRAWVTLMDMPRKPDFDFFDRIQRPEGLYELAGAFIELGDLGSAREMVGDLERVAAEDDLLDVISDVAILHADLAVAEIKRGSLP